MWPPSTELQFLKGVGPKYAAVLRKKGLFTFKDLWTFYPRTYIDQSYNKKISDLQEGENVSLQLEVVGVKSQRISRVKSITTLVLSDGIEVLDAKFFKSPYRGYFKQFEAGAKVQVSGKVKVYRNNFEMVHPDVAFIKKDSKEPQQSSAGLVPVYSESESLNQKKIQKLIHTLFTLIKKDLLSSTESPWLKNYVPQEIRKHYKLLDHFKSQSLLHFPNPEISVKDYIDRRTRAHLSLIFEELFVLEVLTALRKNFFTQEKSKPLKDGNQHLKTFLAKIPFKLTSDQESSLQDIAKDFQKPHPMHRLLQGDVGSGKTLVALASAYVAIQNGYQVVMMAPTEILAQQHFENALKYFEGLNIKSTCLTGKIKGKEREKIEDGLKRGSFNFITGTHALFEERVEFERLGYVIIDEQHRFGVHQRQKLKQKGLTPHFLVMTATPIPRTLTMTLYGDLEVSLIQSMPPGRSPIKTKIFQQKQREELLKNCLSELEKGRQVYFVFPLVSESESLDLKSAEFEFKELSKYFSHYKVGLLHGKMRPQEKDAVMTDFRKNKIQVLVSTTVIEVGVDVPNATVMVIENCERFGLSQLHQLRGRVGRGKNQGFCFLLLGNKFSKESLFRAKVMEKTTNGFEIAEEDLKLRGPGEILGAKQSGLPTFQLADLIKHQKVLIEARRAAFDWVKKKPHSPEINLIKKDFRNKLELINIS